MAKRKPTRKSAPTKRKPTRKSEPAKKTRSAKKSRRDDDDYDNNMRGVMFPNAKRTKKSQPNMTGSAEIEGVEYWVSGWKRTSKSGDPYFSLAFTPKEEPEEDDDELEDEFEEEDENDEDDLPF